MNTAMPLHGANPAALYARLGVEIPRDREILDFSTNTNVVEWEGDFSLEARALMSAYPDPECRELRHRAAEIEGCAPENILFTNGSNEAIYLIASYFSGRSASFADPTYGEYRRACEAYGVREAAERRDADLFFLCNPCNPTGGCVESAEIERMAEENGRQCIVVDEAYIDFLRGEGRRVEFLRFPNVILLRSLTKIFHLCGARIGYVLSAPEWIRRLKRRQPCWSVNAPAQEVCLRFLNAPAFVERTKAFYRSETPRFIARLESLGLEIMPTRTNFFLIRAADDEAMIRALLKEGIVVRHTRNFKGLDGRFIRVSTRLPGENDRFVEAVARMTGAILDFQDRT